VIGIDTNILVRIITCDDEKQSGAVANKGVRRSRVNLFYQWFSKQVSYQ
jgi:predicted nucleic-acid-binding protein